MSSLIIEFDIELVIEFNINDWEYCTWLWERNEINRFHLQLICKLEKISTKNVPESPINL